MSMSYREAHDIAFDPLSTHATTTLDLAESRLKESLVGGRDRDAYVQLADLKARLQRIIGWTSVYSTDPGPLEAINRLAKDHQL